MGGKAFTVPHGTKPALTNFPRMPPPLYLALREQVRKFLKNYFTTVTFPAEAPEKPDHGDLDVLVHAATDRNPSLEHIAELLYAVQSRTSSLTGWTLAVPINAPCFESININTAAYGSNFGTALMQIDLRICKELRELNWRAFKNGYGDLWQILGVLVRPIGLTVDESHMCVRIQELEESGGSKEDTKIRLSDEPDDVFGFLGLDVEEYKSGFQTELQVFEWCARCRFFSTNSLFRHVDDRVNGGPESEVGGEVQSESANINHNDRQRFKKRLMFVRFREWVRSNLDTLSLHNTTYTRSDVFDLAVSTYNKQVHVDAVLARHRRVVREKTLKSRVTALMRQEVLAAPGELAGETKQDSEEVREKKVVDAVSRIMRGMKLFVALDVVGMPFIARPDQAAVPTSKENEAAEENADAPPFAPSQNWADSSFSDEEFMEWISNHWREVDALEIGRRNTGSLRRMRRKKLIEARADGAEADAGP